jgi:beta-lactamase regulating signal transducer with metallopeptidase domain
MSIIQISTSSAIFILLIVVIRALAMNKLPKKTFVVLWGVILLRLLTPFSIPMPFDIHTVMSRAMAFFTGTPSTEITIPFIGTAQNQSTYTPQSGFFQATQLSPMFVVWIAGIFVLAMFFLVTHLRFRREYAVALSLENDYVNGWLKSQKLRRKIQVRYSDMIDAPMTYGIWKPIIVLPKTFDWQDEARLRYVLTHELTHIKRFDILLKWLLVAAVCVHWFNPLVWVLYILANRDIELSCDEKVVWTFGETMKSAYALTLIGLEETKSKYSPLCTNFSKNTIYERVNAIMKIKRKSAMAIVTAVIIVISTAAVLLGTVAASPDGRNVDSGFPDGYESQDIAPAEDYNWETGPQEEDSNVGTLVAVNRNDEGKFTTEEWQDILERVEKGEILFFETIEEETEYFHGASSGQ